MGPVSLGANRVTADSYRTIILQHGAEFYDYIRRTAGPSGPLRQAAGASAEALKTEIIEIIETETAPHRPLARSSPEQTFASNYETAKALASLRVDKYI